MRNIVLYIAASLDGYIADANHGLEWLTVYRGNYGYDSFIATVDTAISERKTYDDVVKMGVVDPYPDLHYYIVTSTPEQYRSSKKKIFTSQHPIDLAKELQQMNGKDIFLVGGGTLIAEFLEHRLIDSIILFIVPIVLGDGIPLFNTVSHSVSFTTESVRAYDDGMIELRLSKK